MSGPPGPDKRVAAGVESSAVTAPASTAAAESSPEAPAALTRPSRAAVVQLALGASHSCALHADGAVSCWGSNDASQLGVPQPDHQTVPVASRPPSDAIQIAATLSGTCMLGRSGAVECWGRFGQTSSADSRVLSVGPVAQLNGGCLRLRDGQVTCWTSEGKLASITGVADARDVAGTADAGCAIVGDGGITCWGNFAYTPGDSHPPPVHISGVSGAVQIATNKHVGCAVLRDHRVSCWGVSFDPDPIAILSRGAGGPPRVSHPVVFFPPRVIDGIDDAISVVIGAPYACVLRTAGTVACWGQLPFQPEVKGIAPLVPVAELRGASSIAAGPVEHLCALRGKRDVVCWGSNVVGELGNGRARPTGVPSLTDAVALWFPDTDGHCALRRSGRLACWGSVDLAYAPREGHWGTVMPIVYELAALPPVAAISELPIDTTGKVWSRTRGGSFIKLPFAAPTKASGSCAIARDRQLWCAPVYADPVNPTAHPVPGIADAVAVSSNLWRTCVLRATGAITCLRDPEDPSQFDVPGITDAIEVVLAPLGAGCAIRKDHSVWCWQWPGRDRQLSLDDTPAMPPEPTGIANARSISVGSDFMCAVLANAKVMCRGKNDVGQLGDGTTYDRTHPVEVLGLDDAVAVDLGFAHACALRRTGGVVCWGKSQIEGGWLESFATKWVEPPVAVAWP